MVEYPIILNCIFPTWTITRRCKTSEDMEKVLEELKVELVSSIQVGEYICCIAKSSDVTKFECLY